MPVYEYVCEACGETFEVTQKMSDPPVTDCACGEKGRVSRLIGSGGGVIFKGAGFYQTDYKGSKTSAKTESAEKPAPVAAAPKAGGHSCGSGCGCHG